MRTTVKHSTTPIATLLVTVTALTAATGGAQEFRRIEPVPTPQPSVTAGIPDDRMVPLTSEAIEAAVTGLFATWNTPAMQAMLSAEFYDQTRLAETLSLTVPRDAKIRVLAIESWSLVAQRREPGPGEWTETLISTIAANVRSQVEFNDPSAGFQRSEGVNEYVFDVTEVIPK